MEPAPKKIKFICLNCDKTFDRVQRLEAHQSKQSCGTTCSTCQHKFPTRRELLRHKKSSIFHDCDLCDKKFCQLVDYNLHQRTVHNINPTQCTTCSKEFSNRPALERHQKNPVYNDCDLCDKKFCSDGDYTNHQIVDHHVNPRICKTCGKEYKAFSGL